MSPTPDRQFEPPEDADVNREHANLVRAQNNGRRHDFAALGRTERRELIPFEWPLAPPRPGAYGQDEKNDLALPRAI